jgi:hypothetical protein
VCAGEIVGVELEVEAVLVERVGREREKEGN